VPNHRRLANHYLNLLLGLVVFAFIVLSPSPLYAQENRIFIVNTTADGADTSPGDGLCMTASSKCSMRAAIQEANASPNGSARDEIHFNVPYSTFRPYTIQLSAPPLPEITEPIIIDGTTQPGYQTFPLIMLSGAFIEGSGLTISAGNSIIRGMGIGTFRQHGIYLKNQGHNIIEGNAIGKVASTSGSGNTLGGNTKSGIHIENSPNNLIGGTGPNAGNWISENSAPTGSGFYGRGGIVIEGSKASGNVIQGNFIGVNGKNREGIVIDDVPNNQIGGIIPEARNYFRSNGVQLLKAGATGNVIQGNYFGIDPKTQQLTNGTGPYIYIAEGATHNLIGGSANTTPGGPCTGACNVFSGAYGGAIEIESTINAISFGNVIQGNFIGTDPTGTTVLNNDNRGSGIKLANAHNTIIGGTQPGQGNLISGWDHRGIEIDSSDNIIIQGNYIGTNVAGMALIGNESSGISIYGYNPIYSSNGTLIGGTEPGARNIIATRGSRGISIVGFVENTRIQGNYIGVGADGITPLGTLLRGVNIANPEVTGTLIGGVEPEARNVIAYTTGLQADTGYMPGVGVELLGRGWVLGNHIFGNESRGIVGLPLPTTFRIDDVTNSINTHVLGSFTDLPSTDYRLEVFHNEVCDADGFGEGEHYLTAAELLTDAQGFTTFDVILPQSIADTDRITLTLTNAVNGTSEFSRCAANYESDLELIKTADRTTLNEGDPLTYTLTLKNNGPDLATNINVQDLLPAEFVYEKATGGYFNKNIWEVDTLEVNQTVSLTLWGTVASSTLGKSFTNTAHIEALDQLDPYSTNNMSEVTVNIGTDLKLKLTVDQPYPLENTNVIYEATLKNKGPGTATNIQVAIDLLESLTDMAAETATGNYQNGIWTIPSLSAQETVVLRLTTQVNPGTSGRVINRSISIVDSDFNDPVLSNNRAEIAIAVGGTDLQLTKTVNNAFPTELELVTYTVDVINTGPNSAENLVISEPLPEGVSFYSAATTAGTYDATTGLWSFSLLESGQQAQLILKVLIDTGTFNEIIVNIVQVSSALNDLRPADNLASAYMLVISTTPVPSGTYILTHAPTDGSEPSFTPTQPPKASITPDIPQTLTAISSQTPTLSAEPSTVTPTQTALMPSMTATESDPDTATPTALDMTSSPTAIEATSTVVVPTITSTPPIPSGTPPPPSITPPLPSLTSTSTPLPLLAESSFEADTDGNQLPDGWKVTGVSSKDKLVSNKPGKIVAYEGEQALRLVAVPSKKGKLQYQIDEVDFSMFQVGDGLELSAWVRGKKFSPGASLSLVVIYNDPALKKDRVNFKIPADFYEYMNITKRLTLKGQPLKAKILLKFDYPEDASGKVYIDVITVEKVQMGLLPIP
jgi:uncharacterized repeat protein (TIGR01451 family)/CSLREA domain-containing protein